MKTPLFILLQATGGIRNEVNTFLSDYAVPVIAMLLIVGVGIGVVMNYDKIIDRDGQGTRKEGIVNLLWVVGYIIIFLRSSTEKKKVLFVRFLNWQQYS